MSERIAIVTPTFPPYRGGIGKVAEMDANQLAAIGFKVTVFTPVPDGDGSGLPYDIVRLKGKVRHGHAAYCPELKKIWNDFDLVMLHYPFYGGAEPLTDGKPKRGGAKLALIYHMDTVGGGWKGLIFDFHRRFLAAKVMNQADTVIGTTADYLHNSNIAPLLKKLGKKEGALPPSVDVDRFAPGERAPELLVRHGLGLSDRVILFVGGLDQAHYFKGVPNLLKAMTVKELAEVKLLVVGDGDLRQGYVKQADELGLSDRVLFCGSVSEEDLPKYYRLADVFAFPSIDKSEAFGVAALEALSSGVPVVASDLPGVRTIVRDGETGWRCPPGSVSALSTRLVDLMGNAVARERFGANARKMVVEEYSDAVRARKLEQIVSDLLKAK